MASALIEFPTIPLSHPIVGGGKSRESPFNEEALQLLRDSPKKGRGAYGRALPSVSLSTAPIITQRRTCTYRGKQNRPPLPSMLARRIHSEEEVEARGDDNENTRTYTVLSLALFLGRKVTVEDFVPLARQEEEGPICKEMDARGERRAWMKNIPGMWIVQSTLPGAAENFSSPSPEKKVRMLAC